jgi:hypothetical protein
MLIWPPKIKSSEYYICHKCTQKRCQFEKNFIAQVVTTRADFCKDLIFNRIRLRLAGLT